jgi:predicted ABC-type ATPase
MAARIAIMLAGPNGAGKTTTAKTLFRERLQSVPFVNADIIAQGLSGGDPDSVALEAGAILLRRLHQLADEGKAFAFETTGASRTFAPWLRKLKSDGYEFHLLFCWVSSPEVAISRVADRVRRGGHHVPADTIRRRYDLGLRNFFQMYSPLATTWQIVNNTGVAKPEPIAEGGESLETIVHDAMLWKTLRERFGT